MVLKSILGSFHQGCLEKFGESSGKQCSCMALYAIVYSSVKSVSRWITNDIDFILMKGDQLYKNQNTDNYLLASELPTHVFVGKCKMNISQGEIPHIGILHSGSQVHSQLTSNISISSTDWNGSIFFIKGYCFAIIPTETHVYIFDSHSRDALGQQCANGYSVLLKFADISMAAHYIINTYRSCSELLQYENNYISVVSEDNLDKSQRYLLLRSLHYSFRKRKLSEAEGNNSVCNTSDVDFTVLQSYNTTCKRVSGSSAASRSITSGVAKSPNAVTRIDTSISYTPSTSGSASVSADLHLSDSARPGTSHDCVTVVVPSNLSNRININPNMSTGSCEVSNIPRPDDECILNTECYDLNPCVRKFLQLIKGSFLRLCDM